MPFDPIGFVNAVLAYLSSVVTVTLQNATQAMLMGTINLLMTSPWPNLATPWFKTFWDNSFGLVLLVSFIYLAISAISNMLSAKDSTLGETVVWVLKNFATGAFMLVLVLGLMALADLAMTGLSAIFGSIVGTPDWGNILLQDHDYTQADALAQFLAFNVTATNSTLLYMLANVSGFALMMYLIWYLFAGLLGNGVFGKVIRSLLLAIVFTQVFARVAQVAFLGIGAIITNFGIDLGFAPIAFAMASAITTTAAMLVVPVMVLMLTIQFYKHERALDPQVIARGLSNQTTTEFSTQKLNSRRAEIMTSARDQARDVSREVAGKVAALAATAGMAKVTAAILAKIPTPHTRAAALAATAISFGSEALQDRVSSRIRDRVSRPGRSRSSKTT